jgi:pre-mRNA-processing factor 40
LLIDLKELLNELRDAGHIVARTKWKDVYPLLHRDERYETMLGNPGSNPLEMFWDIVDELDQVLDQKIDRVEAVMPKSFIVSVNTSQDEFNAALGAQHGLGDEDVAVVYRYV